jgi:hypothetical protein
MVRQDAHVKHVRIAEYYPGLLLDAGPLMLWCIAVKRGALAKINKLRDGKLVKTS